VTFPDQPRYSVWADLKEFYSGRVVKELGLRRTDLIITTKIFWGIRNGSPNDTGLSRKQCVIISSSVDFLLMDNLAVSLKALKNACNVSRWIMLM